MKAISRSLSAGVARQRSGHSIAKFHHPMLSLLIVVVGVLSCATGSQAGWWKPEYRRYMKPFDQSRASLAVISASHELDAVLRDFQSTRFHNVTVSTHLETGWGTGYTVCGFLNTKNKFGAYTGWIGFEYDLSPDGTHLLWGLEPLEHLLRPVDCRGNGDPSRVDDPQKRDWTDVIKHEQRG
jgi:hypothetical protein